MTDEERLVEERICNGKCQDDIDRDYVHCATCTRLNDFLAGLKAGKLQWHKVADGDLPQYGYKVLSEKGVPVIYNRDTNNWFEYSPNADNIKLAKWEEPIAWCEIPQYTEE